MELQVELRGWRRVAYWLVTNEIGIALWAIPLTLLVLLPTYWLGLWWPTLIGVAGVSFGLGWAAARRHWRKKGFVPKL